ncbi:MAG: ribulose-phosphate 3-epimerase [Deltaproteobacteria bacterium]|nr:ribulose-phosphate 3-epimerase [Deltaproteobacteria bacterium]
MKKIAPSILSADFSRLGEEVKAVELAGADLLHLDVMDGHFVPNITMGPIMVAAVRRVTKLPLDTHLMIEHPEKYVEAFIQAGSDMVSVHQEACGDLAVVLKQIKKLGVKAGAVINPATPVKTLLTVLDLVDYVLVMTVNPGFGGQEFIRSGLVKVQELVKLRRQNKLAFEIEVDGGINLSTLAEAHAAGADIFVTGSGIFKCPPYVQTLQQMRTRIE